MTLKLLWKFQTYKKCREDKITISCTGRPDLNINLRTVLTSSVILLCTTFP